MEMIHEERAPDEFRQKIFDETQSIRDARRLSFMLADHFFLTSMGSSRILIPEINSFFVPINRDLGDSRSLGAWILFYKNKYYFFSTWFQKDNERVYEMIFYKETPPENIVIQEEILLLTKKMLLSMGFNQSSHQLTKKIENLEQIQAIEQMTVATEFDELTSAANPTGNW